MDRGFVSAVLLMFCLLSAGVYADNIGFMSEGSGPSLSITSLSSAGEQTSLATGVSGVAGNNPAIQATNYIIQGDTVFIGENNLDISSALGTAGYIAWWQSGNNNTTAPDTVISIPTPQNFFIDPTQFSGKTGNWYQWVDNQKGALVFEISDPSLYLKVWDVTVDEDVTGSYIPMGNLGTFIIESNLYPIVNRSGYTIADSSIKITMTNPAGDNYTVLVGPGGVEHSLSQLQVDTPLWYWIGLGGDHTVPSPDDGWNTTASYLNGTKLYLPGVYTVRAECNVNGMKEFYKAPDGSDYTNKTVSLVHTVQLIDDIVSVSADPSLVIPGESFETKITGLPYSEYYLWTRDTGSMSGEPGDQPPMIALGQEKIFHDSPSGPFSIGEFVFSGGDGKTVRDDVPHDSIYNGTQFYGLVKLDSTGTQSVLWNTSADTKLGSYTLAVQRKTSTGYVGDTCLLTVETGQNSSLNLVSGWNFVSTPEVLANGHNTMGIFSGVNSSGHSVFTYDGNSGSWKTLKAEDVFYPLDGIWVYSVSPEKIPLVSDNLTITPKLLTKGWNSIGIASPDRTAGLVFQPLGSLWSYLVGYNASLQQYTDPLVAGDPEVNTTTLHTKEGFWLYMSDNTTFTG